MKVHVRYTSLNTGMLECDKSSCLVVVLFSWVRVFFLTVLASLQSRIKMSRKPEKLPGGGGEGNLQQTSIPSKGFSNYSKWLYVTGRGIQTKPSPCMTRDSNKVIRVNKWKSMDEKIQMTCFGGVLRLWRLHWYIRHRYPCSRMERG